MEEFLDSQTGLRLLSTVAAIAALVILRWLVARVVVRTIDDLDTRRRWLVLLRNLLLLLLFLTVVVIWADELRTFVLSIVALAAAIAIAGKEIIMCLTGALVRASRPSFRLGDRIEVGGVRGDVIDHRLLTTTLLEIGPGHVRTGKTIVLPNSVFLSNTVINETTAADYVLHTIVFSVNDLDKTEKAEEALLRIGEEVVAEHIEPARAEFARRSEKYGLALPLVEPQTIVELDGAIARVSLRVPVPSRQKGGIEQTIIHRWIDASNAVLDGEA